MNSIGDGRKKRTEKISSKEMRKDAVEMNLSTVLQSISQFSLLSRRKSEVPFKLPIYSTISSRKKNFMRPDDLLRKNRKSYIKKGELRDDDLLDFGKDSQFISNATH